MVKGPRCRAYRGSADDVNGRRGRARTVSMCPLDDFEAATAFHLPEAEA